MEFSVVLGAVMTGRKTTRRHHCSQIRLMILNWADVSTKPLSFSPPPAHTITLGQSGQSQNTEVFYDIRGQFCIFRLKQAPIRLAVLLVQQKTKQKRDCNIFWPGVGEGGVRESTLCWDMHSLPFRELKERGLVEGGCGVGDYEEDMTSSVSAHVLQRHQLLREGVCMTGSGRD